MSYNLITLLGLAAAQSNTKVKEIEATVKSLRQALEETEHKFLDQLNKEKKLEEQRNKDNVSVMAYLQRFNNCLDRSHITSTKSSLIYTSHQVY